MTMGEKQNPIITRTAVRGLLAAAAACAFAALAACNTTEGFGRDVESLGDNIEDTASDAKD